MAPRAKTKPVDPDALPDEGKAARLIGGKWVAVGDTVRVANRRGMWTVRGFCQSRLVKDGPKVWCVDVYQNLVRTFPEDQIKVK